MPLSVKWPHWDVGKAPKWWNALSKTTMAMVGLSSKFFMEFLNQKSEHNLDRLHHFVDNRRPGQGMITFCNHHSCMDEPLIWSILAWRHFLWHIDRMRWTTGAADICFTREYHSKFFSLGRSIPLVRGDGVMQPSVDFAIQQLNAGKWVHIYPEGKVTRDDVRLKWGIGRMVAEAAVEPVVLGFYHVGMDHVLPTKIPYRLHIGKKVTVLVGEPMRFEERDQSTNRRIQITNCVKDELRRLQKLTWRLHGKEIDYDVERVVEEEVEKKKKVEGM